MSNTFCYKVFFVYLDRDQFEELKIQLEDGEETNSLLKLQLEQAAGELIICLIEILLLCFLFFPIVTFFCNGLQISEINCLL